MNRKIVFGAASLCLAFGMPVSAAQANDMVSSASAAIGQNASVEGGRTLQVMVAQAEIKSDINPSNMAVATGGGLLGGLIGAVVDSKRAKKAEELIAPVRTALVGYDVDGLAIESAKKAFANAQWFQPEAEIAFSKDSSKIGKSRILDKSTTGQIAFVEYSYDLTPDFDALRLVMKIEVAEKAVPAKAKDKAEKRLDSKYLVFNRNITSVVSLPSPSEEKEINAKIWAENDAALVRSALEIAFNDITSLTDRTLALSAEDIKVLSDKKNKKIQAGGFSGRPQPTDANSTLLWDGQFIHVQTLQ